MVLKEFQTTQSLNPENSIADARAKMKNLGTRREVRASIDELKDTTTNALKVIDQLLSERNGQ